MEVFAMNSGESIVFSGFRDIRDYIADNVSHDMAAALDEFCVTGEDIELCDSAAANIRVSLDDIETLEYDIDYLLADCGMLTELRADDEETKESALDKIEKKLEDITEQLAQIKNKIDENLEDLVSWF